MHTRRQPTLRHKSGKLKPPSAAAAESKQQGAVPQQSESLLPLVASSSEDSSKAKTKTLLEWLRGRRLLLGIGIFVVLLLVVFLWIKLRANSFKPPPLSSSSEEELWKRFVRGESINIGAEEVHAEGLGP